MESSSSLSFLLTLPLIAALISIIVPKPTQRIYAIFSSVLFFALSIYETGGVLFCKTLQEVQTLTIEHRLTWIPDLGLSLSLKLDAVSAWFVVLNALTAVVAFSTRGTWYRKNPGLFTGLGFFLMFALNAAFLSNDLIAFYLAYEAVFIPMIFMVGVWGAKQKASSVFRFFLMSFLGSILMLVSIFYLIQQGAKASGSYSSYLPDLIRVANTLDYEKGKWVFLGFFLAFAIKVPLVPFHGWLKEVYTNAPAPGTIWMSAILSKLGVFGMIRFVLPLFQGIVLRHQEPLMAIAALSVIYAAFLAIRSKKPKTLLAYSSISHLGFVMLGVFTLKLSGTHSAVMLSVGHTLVSALLFFLLSEVDDRVGDLDLSTPRGLASHYPLLFTGIFVTVLGAVSLPGTVNFGGEFLVLMSAYPVSAFWTVAAALGVILGAVYMLKFYQQLGLGASSQASDATIARKDLGGFELVLVVFMLAVMILGGFQTAVFLKGN
jgi:NADH-quinone oxidoreductase subunit M